MASKIGQENLQKLLDARTTLLEKAFEAVDVKQVMAWQSTDIRFDDVCECFQAPSYCLDL